MKKMKTNETNKTKTKQKHDPPVGDIFEFLGRDTVYTSQVLVSWKQSLEGEFVSDDVSLNYRENTYLVVSHFCSFFIASIEIKS